MHGPPVLSPNATPSGATHETFISDGNTLWAWQFRPEQSGERPVLVYLHGGFGLKTAHVEPLRAYVKAGFVVFVPTFRGRNGNGGRHELIYGEVDDAAAAVRHIANQPFVDSESIYVFGHSMGGATAAMLTLIPNLPIRLSASCGGIYSTKTFAKWAADPRESSLVRFDVNDTNEVRLRLLAPNADQMRSPHLAYFGDKEPIFGENIRVAQQKAGSGMLKSIQVSGNHMSALPVALDAFRKTVTKQDPDLVHGLAVRSRSSYPSDSRRMICERFW